MNGIRLCEILDNTPRPIMVRVKTPDGVRLLSIDRVTMAPWPPSGKYTRGACYVLISDELDKCTTTTPERPPLATPNPGVLTLLGAVLGVSRERVRQLIADGEIPYPTAGDEPAPEESPMEH